MMDLDKPFPSFEHATLGPLPHDPKIIRLMAEVEAWRKKYEQIFQEQCSGRSIDNSLREKLRATELERDKLKAMTEAQKEIIQWLVGK